MREYATLGRQAIVIEHSCTYDFDESDVLTILQDDLERRLFCVARPRFAQITIEAKPVVMGSAVGRACPARPVWHPSGRPNDGGASTPPTTDLKAVLRGRLLAGSAVAVLYLDQDCPLARAAAGG
jgi:hypothetical protein